MCFSFVKSFTSLIISLYMATQILDSSNEQNNRSGHFGIGVQENVVELEHIIETTAPVVSSCLVDTAFHIWSYSGK